MNLSVSATVADGGPADSGFDFLGSPVVSSTNGPLSTHIDLTGLYDVSSTATNTDGTAGNMGQKVLPIALPQMSSPNTAAPAPSSSMDDMMAGMHVKPAINSPAAFCVNNMMEGMTVKDTVASSTDDVKSGMIAGSATLASAAKPDVFQSVEANEAGATLAPVINHESPSLLPSAFSKGEADPFAEIDHGKAAASDYRPVEDTLQPPVLPIVEISADEPSADPGPQIEATGEFGAVMDLIHMASNRADLLSSSLDEIKCALSAYDAARLALVASKSALAQLNGKIGHLLSKEIDAITVGHLGSDEDQNTAHVNRKQLSSRVQGMYSATYTIMENIDARLMGTMHRGNVIASNSRGAPRSYHASPDPHQPQSLHVAIPENLRSAEPVPELASQSREMTASQRTLAVPVPEPVPEPIPVPEVPRQVWR